jgi:hypothetical protein
MDWLTGNVLLPALRAHFVRPNSLPANLSFRSQRRVWIIRSGAPAPVSPPQHDWHDCESLVLKTNRQLNQCVWLVVFSIGLSPLTLSAPLFETNGVLDVVIEAPIRDLSRQRHKEPKFPGTFRYTDATGVEHALAVEVSTRGHSRLELCNYPPLRLTFNRDETDGTLFEGQHEIKVVGQCLRGRDGSNWLHLEYAIYRAYNIITDYSFRVRKLNVTYREIGKSRGVTQPAFLLEDENDLANRLNRERIRPPEVEHEQMALVETTNYMLFQYLVANTDFAVRRGPKGEGCCHNGRVIAEPGKQSDWVIVPYDFDYAGIINTEYALPSTKIPIKRVNQRLYRGFCWQNELLPAYIDHFNERRAEIEAAFMSSGVTDRRARQVQKFIDGFYDIVNDPQELQDKIMDKCRGPDSLPVRESLMSPRHIKAPSTI